MSHLVRAPIADLGTISGGGTPSKSRSEYYTGKIPWVTPKDMKSWEITTAQDKITEAAVRESATNLIPKSSILIVNRSGILKHTVPVAINRVPVAINQDLKAIVCGPKVVPEYLARMIKAAEQTILGWVRATTADNFPLENLKKLEIPLPSLAEQRRIAAILDAADALRQKRRQALRLLDLLSQAIFIEMFGDPVANPNEWKSCRLGEIGTLDRGVSKHRPRNAPELLGGSHPLIQTGDVANCDGYIRTFTSTYSDFGLRQSKKWPAGVLCITIAANIAKTGILTFDACFPDSVVGFQPGDETTTEYVQVWLSFLQKTLEATAPESAQKNINLEILRNLMIPMPPLEQQQEFSRARTAVARLRENYVRGQQIEDGLFASLQHRAFLGEL